MHEKSDPENQWNVEAGKDRAGIGIWKQMASTSPYPAEQPRVWKPESTQESKGEDSEKQEQKSASFSSTCTWKQEPSVNQNKIEQDSGTVRAPLHHYFGKVCQYIQKKLELTESLIEESGEVETNILMW